MYATNSGPDVVHRCDSKKQALDYDSVVKYGNYTEADGTTGTVANANLQGAGTTLVGGLCSHAKNIDKLNVHGKRIQTHRLHKHFETIPIPNPRDICR